MDYKLFFTFLNLALYFLCFGLALNGIVTALTVGIIEYGILLSLLLCYIGYELTKPIKKQFFDELFDKKED